MHVLRVSDGQRIGGIIRSEGGSGGSVVLALPGIDRIGHGMAGCADALEIFHPLPASDSDEERINARIHYFIGAWAAAARAGKLGPDQASLLSPPEPTART